MTLSTEAERAEDVAEAFSKFKDAIPEYATSIAAHIAELYAVGTALRKIDLALDSPEYGRNIVLIETDLELVRSYLIYTIEDIYRILGNIGRGSEDLRRSDYLQTWKEIHLWFYTPEYHTLHSRLATYRRFIYALINILQRFD